MFCSESGCRFIINWQMIHGSRGFEGQMFCSESGCRFIINWQMIHGSRGFEIRTFYSESGSRLIVNWQMRRLAFFGDERSVLSGQSCFDLRSFD